MEYSPCLDHEIEELEDTALHLATCDEYGQIDIQQEQQLCAQLDYLINSFPVDCDHIEQHIEDIQRVWHTRDPQTAENHIQALHNAFLATLCDNYTPDY